MWNAVTQNWKGMETIAPQSERRMIPTLLFQFKHHTRPLRTAVVHCASLGQQGISRLQRTAWSIIVSLEVRVNENTDKGMQPGSTSCTNSSSSSFPPSSSPSQNETAFWTCLFFFFLICLNFLFDACHNVFSKNMKSNTVMRSYPRLSPFSKPVTTQPWLDNVCSWRIFSRKIAEYLGSSNDRQPL